MGTTIQEVERKVPAQWLVRLHEQAGRATIDEAGRTARVVIISEGLGNLRDRNYYTADAVQSAVDIFSGKQFYIDHPGSADEENRPERSVRDLGGYFYEAELGTVTDADTGDELSACFGLLKFADSEPGRLAFDQMKAALEYQQRFPKSKDVYAGISINGGGVSHPGTIRGMDVNVVTAIQEAFSADIVTKPARGGRFLQIVQEARRTGVPVRVRSPKPRAQEARAGGGGMATATQTRPTFKATLRETRRALRRLQRAVKEGQDGKLPKRLRALFETAKHLIKFKEQYTGEGEEQRAIGKLMRVAERLRSARQAAENATATGKDPATIVADMKDDIDNLSDAIQGVMGGGGEDGEEEGEARSAAEREGEDEEEEAEDEDEDESEGGPDPDSGDEEQLPKDKPPGGLDTSGSDRPRDVGHKPHRPVVAPEAEDEDEEEAEDEDEDGLGGGYGMRAGGDEDEDEGEGRMQTPAMRYSCASCGETNRVLPPKGFKLAKMGESKKSADVLEATVRRLQRMLESKEKRFVSHNREQRKLLRENTELRARVMTMERLDMARKALREAGIPPDIMKPKALLPFEPDQWPPLIQGAKALKTREADQLRRGGAGPKDGSGWDGRDGEKVKDAVEVFKESYKKPREFPAG